MKRVFALLLAMLMILCGCASEAPDDTKSTPSTTVPVTEPEAPARPDFGLYEPDSNAELQTGGAVKRFPLEGTDYYAVEPITDGLLLFSGTDTTTVTLLREEADPVEAALNCYVFPDETTLRICEDGLYYFDRTTSEIVSLSSGLQEISRVRMPEDLVDTPALTSDGKLAYYFSTDALRCFELKTGISRLLRSSTFATQQLWGIHFDDAVLECFALDGEYSETLYISAQTGELLTAYDTVPEVETDGQRYFADYFDGRQIQHLVGSRDEKPQCLAIPQDYVSVEPLLALDGCVAYTADEGGNTLDFFNLTHGTHCSRVQLPGVNLPSHLSADENSGLIWLLAGDLSGTQQALYCWDPALSPTGDEANYLTPYYTALEPDVQGLAEIAKHAKALGEKYGVRIRVWEDVQKVLPSDYTFEPEYLVPAYEEYLPVVEQILSAFPEGFLKKLGKSSQNGVLTISLVRQIYGDNALGSLTTASGVHFWDDGSGYIAVAVGDLNADQNLCHEIFHAIDSYVMSECILYDNWPDLNPDGFFYDYDYISNQFREDDQYLEDENRAFIDMYSMSYPKEDRARIFEYAMMEGSESYFQSDIMQLKLNTLCKGIREAFKLKKYSQPLLWEQYLK